MSYYMRCQQRRNNKIRKQQLQGTAMLIAAVVIITLGVYISYITY